jgi:hypothetical protein
MVPGYNGPMGALWLEQGNAYVVAICAAAASSAQPGTSRTGREQAAHLGRLYRRR